MPDAAALVTNLALVNQWGLLRSYSQTINLTAWFLSAVFGCYLALPFACAAVRRWPFADFIMAVLVALIGSFLLRNNPMSFSIAQAPGAGVLRGLPPFLLGVMLARFMPPPVSRPFEPAAVLVASITLFLVGPTLHGLERLALVFAGFASLLWLEAAGYPLSFGQLNKLALYSFGVFLIHFPVQVAIFSALPEQYARHNTWASAPLVIGSVAISFVLAALSLRYFERPLMRWLIGRGEGRTA